MFKDNLARDANGDISLKKMKSIIYTQLFN